MRYDLVIFDNDGVLVDSEPLANRILAAYLTELGFPTSYEDSLRDYMGSAVHRVHDLVHERTGRRLPEEFNRTLLERTVAGFEEDLEPVEGIVDVLRALREQGLPYCVASSSGHARIRAGHRAAGIGEWFDDACIFSAEDVGRGKPAPDLFLHAAREMGVMPERCIVIEDSPLGVEAAVAAGMDVLGFTAMTPADRLSAAGGVFGAMKELRQLLDAARQA
ncbi:HAD family hydrolase [Streptomyces bambusae]|uniref:HAD family hydrolase n=1 Tax=Streptomyces bambusae TaxID=1550616 RepID=UPI001CFFEB71|nr:HAD family hydrolase [Streptomyces bambusae]MCB5169469.1 HAD family hydrolase [Streptomyces bambusae]